LFAAVRIFFDEKAAFTAGFIAALFALPNPILLERSMRSMGLSWWTSFNMSPGDFGGLPAFAPWLILSLVACVLVLLLSITRLLPSRYQWHGMPLSQRSWPAATLTFLALASWYAASVSPYRIPVIVDAASPELTILHVKKNGVRFSEVRIRLYRDGRVYRSTYYRHLFQYAFLVETTMAVAPRELFDTCRSLTVTMKSNHAEAGAIESLNGWNAEGWYVLCNEQYGFTTDAGRQPPEELAQLFDQLYKLPSVEQGKGEMRDICFGFCYDAWAGLGAVYINQRCRWSPDGKTRSCL
jgi:hypothetical protein